MKNELILFKSKFWYIVKQIFILMFVLIILASFVSSNVNDGLVGVWNFDELSGNALDTSGNNYHFTVNGATQGVLAKNSTFKVAYSFDGNDWLNKSYETDFDFSTDDFSFCFFVNISDWGYDANIQTFIDKSAIGGEGFKIFQQGATPNRLRFSSLDSGGSTSVTHTEMDGYDGIYVQVCFIRDETNHSIIVENGASTFTEIDTVRNVSRIESLVIGRLNNVADRYLTGSIDEIVIWNRSIGMEEINYHYNHQYPYITPDITFPSFSDNKTNATSTTPKINDVLQINITVIDNRDIDMVILSTNQSGILTNVSTQIFTGNSDTLITAIFNLSINITRGLMEWQIWANDSSNNVNVSQLFTVEIQNTPPTTPIIYYPVNSNRYSYIPYIKFSSIDNDNDIITYYIYINNTLNITTTVNVTDWNASDGYYNLTISAYDNIIFSDNISILFLLDSISPIITVTSINLTYNETYNTNIWINFTVSERSICSVNSTYFNVSSDYGTNFIWYENTLPDKFYHLNISCNDTVPNIGYKIIYFTKDIEYPILNVTSPLMDNTSIFLVNDYFDIIFYAYENIDLYSYTVNIFQKINEISKYNETNNISGTYYKYIKELSTDEWRDVRYLGIIEICDSHSKYKIKDFEQVEKFKNKIKFKHKGSIFEIISLDNDTKDTKIKKERDKYTFSFEFKDEKEKREFKLISNNYLDYIPFERSGFYGHFVIPKSKIWIDFNPYNNLTLKEINGSYYITIYSNNKILNFNSIGELNCIVNHFEFSLVEEIEETLASKLEFTNILLLFSLFVFIQLFLLFISIKFNLPIILVLGSLMGILISLGFIRYVALSQAFKTSLVIYIFINVILMLTVAYSKIKE